MFVLKVSVQKYIDVIFLFQYRTLEYPKNTEFQCLEIIFFVLMKKVFEDRGVIQVFLSLLFILQAMVFVSIFEERPYEKNQDVFHKPRRELLIL